MAVRRPSTPDEIIRAEVRGAGRHRADREDEPVGQNLSA